MAAVTLSGDWLMSLGNSRAVVATMAFDSSYPTGGESLTPAMLGLGVVDFLIASPTAGYVFEYDKANAKLIAYYADYNATGDGALIEVPAATDVATALAAIQIFAIGR